jgi:hypothetical protein
MTKKENELLMKAGNLMAKRAAAAIRTFRGNPEGMERELEKCQAITSLTFKLTMDDYRADPNRGFDEVEVISPGDRIIIEEWIKECEGQGFKAYSRKRRRR